MYYKSSHYINLKQGFDELAEYLRKKREDVWRMFLDAAKKNPDSYIKFIGWSNEEWDNKVVNQYDPKQVKEYWENTLSHLYILTEVNHTIPQRNLAAMIISMMIKDNLNSVLDFGSGTGENIIDYVTNGLKATAVDVKGPVSDFSKWRFKKRNINVPIHYSLDELKKDVKFDAVTCIEVFQHLPYPLDTLKDIKRILKNGGRIYTTFRFKGNYQPALKKNYHLEEEFDKLIIQSGFIKEDKLYLWGKGEDSKYLHIYMKK